MNKTAKISVLSLSVLMLGAGAVQLAAAADEHNRPEAREHAQGRPAPGRAGGRGQVLDSRYNHGRYYPAFGTVRPALPEGYRPYYRGGSRFYFSGGIWYAPSGPGFVVVRPPVGLVISVLPPYYSTVWLGGVPYYYADNVYYSWQPDQNGYAVVDPPENADSPSPPPDTTQAQQDLIITIAGVSITLVSSWVCVSMNPGASTFPSASICTCARASRRRPSATMRPSRTATSSTSASSPLPSSTRAFRINVSQFTMASIQNRLMLWPLVARRDGCPGLGTFLLCMVCDTSSPTHEMAVRIVSTCREPSLNMSNVAASADLISPLNKGLGLFEGAQAPAELARRNWNLLREDLSLPTAVLYHDRLLHNRDWMRTFIAQYGVLLAPHGKTTMAPQLFHMQLEGGAWGITLATAHQTQVAYEHGVRRVLMANQLVGKQNMAIMARLLSDPGFNFYCLVDSPESVHQLGAILRRIQPPLNVLIELGVEGGRAGVRSQAQLNAVLEAIERWKHVPPQRY